jgi:hypothetical protein
MPTLEIKLTVPEGTTVQIVSFDGNVLAAAPPDQHDSVARYWSDFLSDNARKIYGAAARIESVKGPGYTLEDIAHNLSLDYQSVRSIHRTSGRTAKLWREATGTDEPIRLIDCDYEWRAEHDGMRTTYQLPPGIAEAIAHAPLHPNGPVHVQGAGG